MSKWLRKNDEVIVIAGNDRGKTGKVLAMRGEKIVIQGVNVRKKHMRKSQEHPKGQIVDIECPIHSSNVKHSVEGKPVKLHVRASGKGEKELFYLDENGKEKTFRALRGK